MGDDEKKKSETKRKAELLHFVRFMSKIFEDDVEGKISTPISYKWKDELTCHLSTPKQSNEFERQYPEYSGGHFNWNEYERGRDTFELAKADK